MQVPNVVSNHLTTGLLKYFHTTGRYASGINLFQKLRSQNVEVASLLAKVLFMGNEEVEGARVLYEAIKESPMDYVMLDAQAEFLLKKAQTASTPDQKDERLRMALGCADRSTIAAPSEFGTWARLAQVYVAMEDWENALTILNSCPMFTYQDKDAPMMPEPREVNLPTLPETRLDEIDSEPEARYSEQVDPSLLNLRASAYRGTFKQAYSILTEMTAKIGWDQLLKIRSNVFVMEDEYRTERQDTAQPAYPANRNASTDALRGTPDPAANGEASGTDAEGEGRREGEVAGESEDEEEDDTGEKLQKDPDSDSIAPTLVPNGKTDALERPSSAVDPEEAKKAETESVRFHGAPLLPFSPHTDTMNRMRNTTRVSTTSGCVNAGLTASLWFCTRTSVSTPSGAHKWPSTARRACSTRNLPRSGRFSEALPNGCNTWKKLVRRTGLVYPCGSAPRPSPVFSRCLSRIRARARRLLRPSDWLRGNTGGTASSRPICSTRFGP